ncbi:MAG: AMP-binding protein, partial [Chloroflexota bacterium]
MNTLIELLDSAAERYADKPALSLRGDDDSTIRWSYRELRRRSRIAAWRLRALGLEPGDRVLTWSPSTPELPAAYFGAMLAGIVLVPLDLRMAADAIERVSHRAEAKRLILGTGRDAPDPRDAGLEAFPTTRLDELTRERDETFPADWESRVDAWPRPDGSTIFELIFTSGTTGTPKGVMLAHGNVLASVGAMHRVIPPIEH